MDYILNQKELDPSFRQLIREVSIASPVAQFRGNPIRSSVFGAIFTSDPYTNSYLGQAYNASLSNYFIPSEKTRVSQEIQNYIGKVQECLLQVSAC